MRMARECQAWPGGQGGGVTVRHNPTLLCQHSFTICHKTEVVKNTLNPVWQPFTIPVRALCNGDYDRYGDRDGDRGSHGAKAGYEHLLCRFGPTTTGSSELGPYCFFIFSFATQIT